MINRFLCWLFGHVWEPIGPPDCVIFQCTRCEGLLSPPRSKT